VSLLGRLPTAADTAAGIEITEHILRGETAAFSEDAGFNFRAGREIVTNPTQLLNLYNNNQVDLTEMLAMLNGRHSTPSSARPVLPPTRPRRHRPNYETTDLVQMNGFVYCIMRPR
jgi:hypothetical protein